MFILATHYTLIGLISLLILFAISVSDSSDTVGVEALIKFFEVIDIYHHILFNIKSSQVKVIVLRVLQQLLRCNSLLHSKVTKFLWRWQLRSEFYF